MPRPLYAFRHETLERGVRQRWIHVRVFYARFNCGNCGRVWTSHQFRVFELRGDTLQWPQGCQNCGDRNLPVWFNEVRPLPRVKK